MKPNGRRAWRKAAKKLRRTMGRRWRSQEEWVYGKRWSELVPDLEAHRAHVTGAWFKRHGVTEQGPEKLDAQHLVRVYVGLWGTVDGDSVTYAMKPESFTARSLVGMTQGARKRLREAIFWGTRNPTFVLGTDSVTEGLRIGKRLRPCPGCFHCQPGVKGWHIDRSRSGRFNMPALALHCDGIGVLPARKQK
jgi:hypothetical protein